MRGEVEEHVPQVDTEPVHKSRMCSPYNVFFTLSLVMQCVCLSPKPTCILYTHTRGAACDAKLKSMFSRMRRRLKTEPQPLNPKP